MGTVSCNLKVYTCNDKISTSLNHYSLLQKPTMQIQWQVGVMILPIFNNQQVDKSNQHTILEQLNNRNCFNLECQHQENDILELHY